MIREFIDAEYSHPEGVGSANVGSPAAIGTKVVRGTSPLAHPAATTTADADGTGGEVAAELDAAGDGGRGEHPEITAATTTLHSITPRQRS